MHASGMYIEFLHAQAKNPVIFGGSKKLLYILNLEVFSREPETNPKPLGPQKGVKGPSVRAGKKVAIRPDIIVFQRNIELP